MKLGVRSAIGVLILLTACGDTFSSGSAAETSSSVEKPMACSRWEAEERPAFMQSISDTVAADTTLQRYRDFLGAHEAKLRAIADTRGFGTFVWNGDEWLLDATTSTGDRDFVLQENVVLHDYLGSAQLSGTELDLSVDIKTEGPNEEMESSENVRFTIYLQIGAWKIQLKNDRYEILSPKQHVYWESGEYLRMARFAVADVSTRRAELQANYSYARALSHARVTAETQSIIYNGEVLDCEPAEQLIEDIAGLFLNESRYELWYLILTWDSRFPWTVWPHRQ